MNIEPGINVIIDLIMVKMLNATVGRYNPKVDAELREHDSLLEVTIIKSELIMLAMIRNYKLSMEHMA